MLVSAIACPRNHRCQHPLILAMSGCFVAGRQCQDAAEIAFEAKRHAAILTAAGCNYDPPDERPEVIARLKPGLFVGKGLESPWRPACSDSASYRRTGRRAI